MKNMRTVVLLPFAIMLMASACVRPYYLSLSEREKTNKSLNYRIEREIIVARLDTETSVIQAWLKIENYTPNKATVTIDCRFYDRDRTPNEPISSDTRTIILEPWQVRTEAFHGMSLPPYDINAWCGMVDSNLVSTADTTRNK